MKKILILAVVVMALIGGMGCIEWSEADDGVKVNALVGTYFNADVDNFDGTDELNITRDKADWFGSVNVSYGIGKFAPFVSYEERRTVFNETQAGVDYMVLPNVGIRGAWVKTDIEGVSTVSQGFVGVKLSY